jgi:hypothetical protein
MNKKPHPSPLLNSGEGDPCTEGEILKSLRAKLSLLRLQVQEMETSGMDVITNRRIGADMGDDPRENEGAKLVMEQHDMWYIRKVNLKKEIAKLKQEIYNLKTKKRVV